MNQRIRYSKNSTGVLVSRRRFTTSSGQEVIVELNLGDKKYRIIDSVTGTELSSGGNTTNVSVLKIQAKRGLTGLGVSFKEEVRNREVLSSATGR